MGSLVQQMVMAARATMLQLFPPSPRACIPAVHALLCLPSCACLQFRRTDAEWRQMLSPESYRVLRLANTEKRYSSPLVNEKRAGTFCCGGCGLPLFASETKFESGELLLLLLLSCCADVLLGRRAAGQLGC